MTLFEMVEQFNVEVIKVTKPGTISPLSEVNTKFLTTVIREETREFLVAKSQADIVGQVDALIDLMYFAMGGLTRLGITHDQSLKCFEAVHAANMSKVRGDKGRGSIADAIKPALWRGPEAAIKQILNVE